MKEIITETVNETADAAVNETLWKGIQRHIHPLSGLDQAVIIEVRPGYAKFSIEIPPESINLYGIVHGGFLFTLCDTAAGMATYAYGMVNTTQNGSIHYIKSVSLDTHKIYVESRTIHKGRSTVVNQVEITTEAGQLAAVGTFTMFLLKPVELPG